MFKFMRRFAVVYNGPDFFGVISYHWTESGAQAQIGIGKVVIALTDSSDVIDPRHLSVIPVEKNNRNKGTIQQGYAVLK